MLQNRTSLFALDIVIHDTSFWRKTPLLPHSSGRSCACKELIWPRPGRLPERRPSEIPGAIANRCSLTAQAAWNRSSRCAGARGGARVGRPRWARILTITGGSSMAAMIFKPAPQFGQCSMSMSKPASVSAPNSYGRACDARDRLLVRWLPLAHWARSPRAA